MQALLPILILLLVCLPRSWALIRLVIVKLAHHSVKNFLPLTGLDFTGTHPPHHVGPKQLLYSVLYQKIHRSILRMYIYMYINKLYWCCSCLYMNIYLCLCHRSASHFPSQQCSVEDFRKLGTASAGANEQVWWPASQLHQHLSYWPQCRRRPCHTATQGHAGARQHTLQVRIILYI